MKTLTFHALRVANSARLPQFKNSRGQPAHSKEDGSDWTVGQWLQACLGELGEFASVRVAFELGTISREEYEREARKELADVATYFDILARRAFDENKVDGNDVAFEVMQLLSELGQFANERKKFDRGDHDVGQFRRARAEIMLARVRAHALWLERHYADPNPPTTTTPHPEGVNLDEAIAEKFNAISERVGSTIQLVSVEYLSGHPESTELMPHDSKTERFL